jgi:tetratricopeptide (TPR) repeat protein
MVLMIPSGLLPEHLESRRPVSSWAPSAAAIISLLAFGVTLVEMRRIARERDEALARIQALEKKVPESPSRAAESPRREDLPPPSSVNLLAGPPASPGMLRSPDIRLAPAGGQASEHLIQGFQEFRAGRYEQAERQFFRAFPESLLYLALCCLAENNYGDAFAYLFQAMRTDPKWLRKVRPSDLFGSEAAYRGVLQALELQVSRDPLNPDLKTLLAYLRYHDQGPAYAKGLLVEVSAAVPDHEAAKAFMEALEP